jgi:ClpX C4-type zinc finger
MSALANGLDQEVVVAVDISCSFCRRGRHQVVRLVVCGHAAICGECIGDALVMLRETVAAGDRPTPVPTVHRVSGDPDGGPAAIARRGGGTRSALGEPAPTRWRAPPLTGGDAYTGEMCDHCGNFRMIRTGTCSTCLDCGENSGGCS